MRYAVIALLCVGCVAPPREQIPQPVLVLSEPPGARILVDGEYVGDAPITVTLTLWRTNGRVNYETHEFKAIPKDSGYVQVQRINNFSRPFPRRILFSTGLGPPAREIDLNLTGQP